MVLALHTPVHESQVAAWGDLLGDRSLASAIYSNPRLRPRAMVRMAELAGIDGDELEGERAGALHAVRAVMSDRDRMVRLSGLIVLRGLLHGAVTRAAYEALSACVSHDELDLAAGIAATMPKAPAIQVDPSRIAERITAAGEGLLSMWAARLSPVLKKQIEFAFGEDGLAYHGKGVADVPPSEASSIVELAARGLPGRVHQEA